MRNYGIDYPGFVNPPDQAYPYSSPKNATTDTAEDGTPVEEKWVGDVWGFFQSAVSEAGITPNGQTESVSNPQILSAIKKIANIASLSSRVGQKAEIHSSKIPDWLLKADGSNGISRTVDDALWAHASASGLVISQATKEANPEQYAMYYGDGDGSTTFSLPNWYLGHFARGNPAGVLLGETQGDAIREITGAFNAIDEAANTGSGAFRDTVISSGWLPSSGGIGVRNSFNFAASREVPVANENRPKTGNITICIERGKIPA